MLKSPLKIVIIPKLRHRIHFGTFLSGGGSSIASTLPAQESNELADFALPTPSGIRWTAQPISFLSSIIESGPRGIKTSEISKKLHFDPRSSYFFSRRLEAVNLIEAESIKSQSSNLLRAKRFIPSYGRSISLVIASGIDVNQLVAQISELSVKAGGAVCLEDIVSSLWRIHTKTSLTFRNQETEEPASPLFTDAIKYLLKGLLDAGQIKYIVATVNNSSAPVECYQPIDTKEGSKRKLYAENIDADEHGGEGEGEAETQLTLVQKWFKANYASLIGIPIKIQILEVLRRLGPRGAIISELCALLNLRPKGLASLMESYKSPKKASTPLSEKSIVTSITEHCGRSRRIRYFYQGPLDRPLSIKWVLCQPRFSSCSSPSSTEDTKPITKEKDQLEPKKFKEDADTNTRSISTTRLNREKTVLQWLSHEKVIPVTRELAKRLQENEGDFQYLIDTRSVVRIAHSLASRNLAKTLPLKMINSEQQILLLVSLDLLSEGYPLHNHPQILGAIEKEKERLSAPRTVSSSPAQARNSIIKINRLFNDNPTEDIKKVAHNEMQYIDYGFVKSPIRRLYIFHCMIFRLASTCNMLVPSPASGAKIFSANINSLYLWEFLALFSVPRSKRLATYLGFENPTLPWQTIQSRLNQKLSDSLPWIKNFLIDKRTMDTQCDSNDDYNASFGGADYPIRKKWLAYLASLAELGILSPCQDFSPNFTAPTGGLIVLNPDSQTPIIGVEDLPMVPPLQLALKSPSGIDISCPLAIDRFWAEFEFQLISVVSSKKNADDNSFLSVAENPESCENSGNLEIAAIPSSDFAEENSGLLSSESSQYAANLCAFIPFNLPTESSSILATLKSLCLSFYKPLDALCRFNFRCKPRKLISELFTLEQCLPLEEILKSFKSWISIRKPSPSETLLALLSISSDYKIPLSVMFSSETLPLIANASQQDINNSTLLCSFEELRILVVLFILWFLFPPQMASALFCMITNNEELKEMKTILSILFSDEKDGYSHENISVVFSDVFPVIRSSILGNGRHKTWAENQIKSFIRPIFDPLDSDSPTPLTKQASCNFFDIADSITLDLLLPNSTNHCASTSFEDKKLKLGINLSVPFVSTERIDPTCQSVVPRTCLFSCSELQFCNSNSTLNAILTSASSSVKRRLVMYDLLHTGFISNTDIAEPEDCCSGDVFTSEKGDQRKVLPSSRTSQATFVDFEPDEELIGSRANLDNYSDELFIRGEEKFANSSVGGSNHSALVCQSALKSVVAFGSFPTATSFTGNDDEYAMSDNSDGVVEAFPIESLFAIFGSTSPSRLAKKSSLLIQIALGLKRDGVFTKRFYFGQELPILSSKLRKACCGLSLSFTDRYDDISTYIVGSLPFL